MVLTITLVILSQDTPENMSWVNQDLLSTQIFALEDPNFP